MKRILLLILLLLAVMFLADRAGALVMEWVNERSNDVTAPKIRYVDRECDADMVIFGTSRANCHYMPSVIGESAGCSVYNAGVDGSKNIYAHYFMLCRLLRHHTPSVVCLDLLEADYAPQENSFSSLGFFAPYMGSDAASDSVFRESDDYIPWKISRLYRYNSKAVSNLGGLLRRNTPDEEGGFMAAPDSRDHPDSLVRECYAGRIDIKKMEYLGRFADKCREKGIRLIFVVSPRFSEADSLLYSPLRAFAMSRGIRMLDYHTSAMFHDRPELFRDFAHLNKRGARLFSSRFARDITGLICNE